MRTFRKTLALILTGTMLSTILFAQTTPATATPEITKKQVQQRQRIKEGVRSGELTKAEARRLRMREAKIQHDKKMAKADGVVTPQERAKIKAEQRRTSKAIYHQKHDAQVR